MLRAITFDFWGTLYQNAWAREQRLRLLQETLHRTDQVYDWESLDAAYEHAWGVFDQLWLEEHRSITFERWLGEMLAHLQATLPEDVQAGLRQPMQEVFLREGAPRPVPGVSKVLPRLAQRYRLGLISDVGLTPGRVLRELIRRDGLLSYFDTLTFSDETGVTKPMPEPFLRTLGALDAEPWEAIHIGDLPETDLVGARRVGMGAILFLGVSHREDGRALADAVFEEYTELESLLDRWETERQASKQDV